MASLSPNPFVTPVPSAAPPVVPPPISLAVAPASALPAGPPLVDAGPFSALDKPPPPAGDSRGSLGAWTDATACRPAVPLHADSTGSIRDALLKMRRARLTRIVKGVVGVSAFVCLVALGRAAIGGRSGDAEAATVRSAAATMRSRDAGAPATVQPAADTLTKSTSDAINGVVHVVPVRAAPPHRHKRH